MSSEEILSDTKCILTGLLTSNPLKCTIRQLCNDFSNTVGYSIPFRQLGFTNVENFLRSIPDTIRVCGSGPLAEVDGIIKPKSAHINELVSKQRCNNKALRKRRAIHPRNRFQRPSYNYHEQATNATTNQRHYQDQPSFSNNTSQRFSSEVPQLPNNNLEIPQLEQSFSQLSCKKSDYAASTKTNDYDDYKSNVSREVQNNLRKLIRNFPTGVNCTQLPDEYRKMFNKGLHYERFNYRSLIEMIADLPEIFHYLRISSDDFVICSVNDALPDVKHFDGYHQCDDVEEEDSESTDFLSEIPKSELLTVIIPDDVVNIGDKIASNFSTLNCKEGEYFDITIGEIYDLSKFYIYITYGGLKKLMDELQEFFKQFGNKYIAPEFILEEGLYCVTKFYGEFHRAIVINLLPAMPDTVRVLFIDYGTVSNVSSKEIWYLPKKFATLETQAIRTRLSKICPINQNSPWDVEAIRKFKGLIARKILVAEIMQVVEEDEVLEVYLADITREDNIFYINDVLVDEGHAVFITQERKEVMQDPAPKVMYLHYFPGFDELESGYAYSGDDLQFSIDHKTPLHHHMPQYFDILFNEHFTHVEKIAEENFKPDMKLDVDLKKSKKIFDFAFFPENLRSAIRDEVKNIQFGTPCQVLSNDSSTDSDSGEKNNRKSVKEYSCNKKRISELIYGTSDTSDSVLNNQILKSDVEEASFNLNDCDNISVISNLIKTFKPTNPFLPDLEHIIDSQSKDYIKSLSKPSEVTVAKDNDINSNNTQVSTGICKVNNKQVNLYVQENVTDTSLSVQASSSAEISTINSNTTSPGLDSSFESKVEVVQRTVKTPPGFTSRNRGNQVTNTHYMFANPYNMNCNNPYYAGVPMQQFDPATFYGYNRPPFCPPPMGPRPYYMPPTPGPPPMYFPPYDFQYYQRP